MSATAILAGPSVLEALAVLGEGWMPTSKTGKPNGKTAPAAVTAKPAAAGNESDAVLLAAVAGGDPDAFRRLVDRHLPQVLRVARRMLGDAAEADDVGQDVLLRLWRNAASIEVSAGGLGGWLYRVTTNAALDRLRARKPQSSDGLDELQVPPDQFQDLANRDLAARVEAALQSLPERQRLALVLCHYEGMTMQEAGAIIGASEEGIESLLSRGRRTLRKNLESEWRQLVPATGES